MGKRILVVILLFLLLLWGIPISFEHPNNPTDTSTLVVDMIGGPESLDPAWQYDLQSGEVVMNVYEPLVFYDRVYTDNYYQAGKTDRFVGKLGTDWKSYIISEISPHGVSWAKRFKFTIRSGVTFHNGNPLTPEDVEYSFERWMVQDRVAGSQWMIYQWILGVYEASNPTTDPDFGYKIDEAFQHDSTAVWINCNLPVPDTVFYQILSQPQAGIVNKAWAQSKGDLNVESVPGYWSNWAQIYATWHDPPVSFIEGDMIGTGPYKFSYWLPGVATSVVKYDNYWDGWPAWKDESRTERLPSFISTIIWNVVPDWTNRKARFLAGTSDMTFVSRLNRDEVLGQPGIRCWYGNTPPRWLLSLGPWAAFFTFDINTVEGANPYAPTWYRPEAIYDDVDDSGTVTAADVLLGGDVQPIGTPLIAFQLDEKHAENVAANGGMNYGEAVYRDVDSSGTVTVGDVLLASPIQPDQRTTLINFHGWEKHAENVAGNGKYDVQFGTGGIPPQLFSDVNVRKGFAYAFDYGSLISSAYLDEGIQASDPVVGGISYDNVAQVGPTYDVAEAKNHLMLAWGGALLASGTATGGSSTTLVDPSRQESTDYWTGRTMLITSGSGKGEHRFIADWDFALKTFTLNHALCEAVYREVDNNGKVTTGDLLLEGPEQREDIVLVEFASNEKHAENVLPNGLMDYGEAVYRDVDDSGTVTAGDVLLLGAAQPLGTALIKFALDLVLAGSPSLPIYSGLFNPSPLDKYCDLNSNGVWDVGEPAIRDNNINKRYDAGDTVLVGAAPPVDSSLSNPGASDKHYDPNSNGWWDVGEQAVRDTNSNLLYDGNEKHAENIAVDALFNVNSIAAGDTYSIYDPGALWQNGMKFTIPYYSLSNPYIQKSAEIFTNNINALNPDTFKLDSPVGVSQNVYKSHMFQSQLPIFITSFWPDYPDPDVILQELMYSSGTFAEWQKYSNQHVDDLIERGAIWADDTNPYAGELDTPDGRTNMNHNPGINIPPDTRWPRRSIYYELQAIYAIDDLPSVCLVQQLGRHWERDWMRGWYYNPMYPGVYAYHLWKAVTHFGDANNDGTVSVIDASIVSAHWSGPPTGPLGYGPQADLTGGTGGTIGSDCGVVPGIPDGKVNILDAAMVSAYWTPPV